MATASLSARVLRFALLSRFALIILQAAANLLVPDHDAEVFGPQKHHGEHHGILDRVVVLLVGGFRRWDAVYLTHVAEYGYTYENCLAFFPLYPLVIRSISSSCWYFLYPILEYSSIVLLVGVATNFFLFVMSAQNIFQLGKLVTKNDTIAYKGALLFCVNPASVFMSAPYSETLFAFLSISGMLQLQSSNKLKAGIYFGLSCATRSNGLLNIGYLGYRILRELISRTKMLRKSVLLHVATLITTVWYICMYLVPYCLVLMLVLVPFLLYQWYAYHLYCLADYSMDIPDHLIEYGRQKGLKIFGDPPSPWCNNTIPLAYSYIQSYYWDQGFLRYWQLKQVPNFLLALPVTVLVVGTAVSYIKNNRYTCCTMGLNETGSLQYDAPITALYQLHGVDMLPYVLHAVALTIFGWLFIHVQVLTRLLFSSCPVLYWYTAHLISDNLQMQKQTNKYDIRSPTPVSEPSCDNSGYNLLMAQIYSFKQQTPRTKAVLSYFLGYFILGTVLFSNFLPWT